MSGVEPVSQPLQVFSTLIGKHNHMHIRIMSHQCAMLYYVESLDNAMYGIRQCMGRVDVCEGHEISRGHKNKADCKKENPKQWRLNTVL